MTHPTTCSLLLRTDMRALFRWLLEAQRAPSPIPEQHCRWSEQGGCWTELSRA
jgi:hypothetical protein